VDRKKPAPSSIGSPIWRCLRTSNPPGILSGYAQAPGGVNAGFKFVLKNQTDKGKFETYEFKYENGISDYVASLRGECADAGAELIGGAARPRSGDKPDISCASASPSAFFPRPPAARVLS
jgi:hypothetical protein